MESALHIKALETHGISTKCMEDVWQTLIHLFKLSPWALKMFDSMSKIPEGILNGNILDFGNYKECLDVNVKESWGSFVGRHCLTLFDVPVDKITGNNTELNTEGLKDVFIGFSFCVPSTCTPEDLQFALSKISKRVFVEPMLCHTQESPPLQQLDWISIYVLLILLLLAVFSTAYDLLVVEEEQRNRFLLLFSVYSNGKSLFSTKGSPEAIEPLHGIRFLSITWIIVGHTMLLAASTPAVNLITILDLGRNLPHTIPGSAMFAVDTFFVISGLLLGYVFMKNAQHFNLPVFYLHRILRVLPVLGLLVLIHCSISKYLGDGPLWDIVIHRRRLQPCQEYWWSTLLFVQNYVNPNKQCITTSWFLAVDMQLYIISPLILFGLLKKPKISLGCIASVFLFGVCILFVNAYMTDATPNAVRPNYRPSESYYQTHIRYTPWLVGIVLGYIMHISTEWRARVAAGTEGLSKLTVVCGWIIAIMITTGSILAIYPFEQKDYVYSPVEASLYFALTRPLWSIAVAWVIFACWAGYGGIASTILCWPAFRPLSRLTFCIYLLHFDILMGRIYSMKTPIYTNDENMAAYATEVLVLSILGAIILTLLVESPIIRIEKILLRNELKKFPQANESTVNDLTSLHSNKNDSMTEHLSTPPRHNRRI